MLWKKYARHLERFIWKVGVAFTANDIRFCEQMRVADARNNLEWKKMINIFTGVKKTIILSPYETQNVTLFWNRCDQEKCSLRSAHVALCCIFSVVFFIQSKKKRIKKNSICFLLHRIFFKCASEFYSTCGGIGLNAIGSVKFNINFCHGFASRIRRIHFVLWGRICSQSGREYFPQMNWLLYKIKPSSRRLFFVAKLKRLVRTFQDEKWRKKGKPNARKHDKCVLYKSICWKISTAECFNNFPSKNWRFYPTTLQ